MTEMVERVARAIAAAFLLDPDEVVVLKVRDEALGPDPVDVDIHQWEKFEPAAKAAIEAMSDWQPIETAPKDGTSFLAYVTRGGEKYACVLSYDAFLWGLWSTFIYRFKATHWMPLPEPPEKD